MGKVFPPGPGVSISKTIKTTITTTATIHFEKSEDKQQNTVGHKSRFLF